MIESRNAMKDHYLESYKESDLRVQKTYKALTDTLFAILNRRNFNSVTVNDLCLEARVSRATFYSHFRDKYDLLKYILGGIKVDIVKDVYSYDDLERDINHFVYTNKKLVTNILKEANSETLALMRGFMSSIVELMLKRNTSDETNVHHIVLFNFLIGGFLNMLTWIVENNFPPEVPMMNAYLYKMLDSMTTWDANQDPKDTTQAE